MAEFANDLEIDPRRCLPDDGTAGTLIGRCWLPGAHAGPAVVVVREQGVFDLSARWPISCAVPAVPTPTHRACWRRSTCR